MNIKLAFLGTGTCNSTPRNPSALALSNGDDVVLIDCGGGCYHQISRLNSDFFRHDAISAVLLTHFHVDHVSGLADLIWGEMWDSGGPRTKPLVIAGPPGVARFISERLLPFIGNYDIPFTIHPVEMPDNYTLNFSFFSARAYKLEHADSSNGYMITAGKTRLAITGDTGFCDKLVTLLSDSGIAVIEWSRSICDSYPSHLSNSDIKRLIEMNVLPPRVYITHMYLSRGLKFNQQVRENRDFLGQHAGRFLFPEDLDVIDIE